MSNFEDFGWSGDESFLDAENFALEQNELRAMEYEEQQKWLAEEAEADEAEADEAEADEATLDDCPMDGDAESALASCGWGTDEDYGYYGGEDW